MITNLNDFKAQKILEEIRVSEIAIDKMLEDMKDEIDPDMEKLYIEYYSQPVNYKFLSEY